jgi:superfamily II DNA/RNA helicase
MQEAVIGKAASSNNLMLVAPTGTGKTLAFLIAVYNKLSVDDKGIQAIVVAPSRELALQIEQVFKNMKTLFKVTCCYGGHSIKIEQDSLRHAWSSRRREDWRITLIAIHWMSHRLKSSCWMSLISPCRWDFMSN